MTRLELAGAIRENREGLQREILQRVQAIADPRVPAGPEYVAGTRDAVSAALDYATAVLEGDDEPPVPQAVLLHARLAARSGIGLATVLRRYMAGFSLLSEAALRIVGVRDADRDQLLLALSIHLDLLLAKVGEDYVLEQESRRGSSRSRRAEAIGLLLAGMPGARAEIPHQWDGWHVGFVGVGSKAKEQLLALAAPEAPGQLLLEEVDDEVWAWVSSRSQLDPVDLVALLPGSGAEKLALGVGEAGNGLEGWRRSHRQASAALLIARRSNRPVSFYAKVGIAAAIFHDDLFISSLRDRYLRPLEGGGRDEELRRTLRGYLSTECNVSSTAAALGVSRRTVRNRLRRVEEKTGLRIGECLAELDLALRVAELKLV